MNFKQNMIVALILTTLTAVLLVVASPLVPFTSFDAWVWIALFVGAAATLFWVSALQRRSVEETGSTDF